ncbi:hypothetical protein VYU27_001232 [Nannochloropsis oceanica]
MDNSRRRASMDAAGLAIRTAVTTAAALFLFAPSTTLAFFLSSKPAISRPMTTAASFSSPLSPAGGIKCRDSSSSIFVACPTTTAITAPHPPSLLLLHATAAKEANKATMSPRRRSALEAEFRRLALKTQGLYFVSLSAFYTSGEVAELLKEKLLAKTEVDSFWMGEVGDTDEMADLEGFLAVYDRIDALFEDGEEEEEVEEEEEQQVVDQVKSAPPVGAVVQSLTTAAASAAAAATAAPIVGGMLVDEFMASADVARYLEEDLVTKEEVIGFWRAEAGVESSTSSSSIISTSGGPLLPRLSREATLRVYAKIEELFEDEEKDSPEMIEEAAAERASVPPPPAASAEDAELWAEYTAAMGGPLNSKMDYMTFLKTNELPALMAEELISREEVKAMWDNVARGELAINFEGFKALSSDLDDLFMEEEDWDTVAAAEAARVAPESAPARQTAAAMFEAAAAAQSKAEEPEAMQVVGPAKPQLLEVLGSIKFAGLLDDDKATDEYVAALVEAMIEEDANLAVQDELEIAELQKAMEGDWDLAYSTSRTMRYNRGLSGLGKSLPQAEFVAFRQSIAVNGYAFETVYTEKLKTLGRELDVVVEGAWELKDVVSIMDGELCLIMDVLPATIKYGFMNERIETGWKGVRVLNRCELLYLDQDTRVMKGQSSDSYFVFRRRADGSTTIKAWNKGS